MAHKRRHAPEGSQGVNLSLIITPMLDMSFQILAFFIMTYHPSALEGHIPGSLVPPENFAKKGKDSNTPANPLEAPISVPEEDLLPELNDAIQVKVKAVSPGQQFGTILVGEMKQVLVRQPPDTEYFLIADVNTEYENARDNPKARRVEGKLDKDYVFEQMMLKLRGRLEDALKKGATKKGNLKIEGDNDLRQRYVMMVYDNCKRASFEKIGFVPPPVLNTKLK